MVRHQKKTSATSQGSDLTDSSIVVLLVVGVVAAASLLLLLLLLEPEAAERRLRPCRALRSLLLRGVARPPGC